MIYRLTKLRNKNNSLDADGKPSKESTAWNGITKYTHTKETIGCEYDRYSTSGEVITGLTPAEARRLEKENHLKDGELAADSDYWHTKFFIPFPEEGIILNDEKAADKIKLAVLKAMKKVANGRDDLKKKSKAIYLLTSDQKIEQEDDDRLSIKEEAYALLRELTPQKQRQVFAVIQKEKKGGKVVDASTMSETAVKNQLRIEIESNAVQFTHFAKDSELQLKAEILELIANKILGYNSGGYFRGPDKIAYDLDSMVAFAGDPSNQATWVQMKQELQVKQKGKKA